MKCNKRVVGCESRIAIPGAGVLVVSYAAQVEVVNLQVENDDSRLIVGWLRIADDSARCRCAIVGANDVSRGGLRISTSKVHLRKDSRWCNVVLLVFPPTQKEPYESEEQNNADGSSCDTADRSPTQAFAACPIRARRGVRSAH